MRAVVLVYVLIICCYLPLGTAQTLKTQNPLFTNFYAQKDFTAWKAQYGKVYSNSTEEHYRYGTWLYNLYAINNHNARLASAEPYQNKFGDVVFDATGAGAAAYVPTYSLRMNKFGDLTFEEFSSAYVGRLKNPMLDVCRSLEPSMLKGFGPAPQDVDWRAKGVVNPIKDQGGCGSCWAFSAVGAIESAFAIKNGTLFDLSEQQLVDCSGEEGNFGCNGGWMDWAFNYTLKAKGLCTEAAYPYKGVDGQCQDAGCEHVVQIKGCVDINLGPMSEAAMQAVLGYQPVAIATDVAADWQFYGGGVYDNPFCGNRTRHAILIVGYSGVDSSWTVRNSWGTDWGDKGYIHFAMNKNICGLADNPTFPLV